MAQFVEVMRQAKRLCAARYSLCDTNNCPLDSGEACRLNVDLDGEDFSELERIIMDWAADHPEPVYPSWYDYQQQTFPEHTRWICPMMFGVTCPCASITSAHECTKCRNNPIPAEIAEKLGIKPTTKDHAIKHSCDNCKYARRKPTDEPCVRCNHCCIDFAESILPASDLWEAAK